RKAPAWAAASLLPSTRLLLKRRQAAEAERALQAQRQVRRPAPTRCRCPARPLPQPPRRPRRPFGRGWRAWSSAGGSWPAGRSSSRRRSASSTPSSRPRERRQRPRPDAGPAMEGGRQAVPPDRGGSRGGAFLRSWKASPATVPMEGMAPGWLVGDVGQARLAVGLRWCPGLPPTLPQETHWTHIQTTAVQKTLLLGQIRMAVLNLFQLATKQLKVPADVALEDTEAQLDTVLLCMQDLAAICAELCPGEPAAARKRPPLPPAPPSQA
uniref:Uncharacterized protein n=1 Tax=Dromaius novaehollandiae TaxID=8790 RepID=A0A8C4P6E1_DRONO